MILIIAAAWFATGLFAIWLIDRYFRREYDDGLPTSRWLMAIDGPVMLYLAIDLLLLWAREDRLYAASEVEA